MDGEGERVKYVHFFHPNGSFRLKEGTARNTFSDLISSFAHTHAFREKAALAPQLRSMLAPPPEATSEEDVQNFYRYALFVISRATTRPLPEVKDFVPITNLPSTTLEENEKSFMLSVYSADHANPLILKEVSSKEAKTHPTQLDAAGRHIDAEGGESLSSSTGRRRKTGHQDNRSKRCGLQTYTHERDHPRHLHYKLRDKLSGVKSIWLDKDAGKACFRSKGLPLERDKSRFRNALHEATKEDREESERFKEKGAINTGHVFTLPPTDEVAEVTEPKERKLIASYSWNMMDPSVPYSVPGLLGVYTRPETPIDPSKVVSQLDRRRSPSELGREHRLRHFMEATVMACLALDKHFKLNEYHIVTDRNNLRKIFRWICGFPDRFRIDLEKVSSDTVIMMRYDLADTEISRQNEVMAESFEALCCGNSHDSYRALVEFQIAETRVLMRCEIDGAMPGAECSSTSSQVAIELLEGSASLNTGDSPDTQRISSTRSPLQTLKGSLDLCFKHSGATLAREFVELKTCVPARFEHWEEHLDYIYDTWFQSYLAGVHTLVFGIKDERRIKEVKEFSPESFLHHFGPNLRDEAMKRLTATMNVVNWIKQCLANEPQGAKFSLIMEPTDDPETICLFKRPDEVEPCLPPFLDDDADLRIIDLNQ